jgi:hypothetical protein
MRSKIIHNCAMIKSENYFGFIRTNIGFSEKTDDKFMKKLKVLTTSAVIMKLPRLAMCYMLKNTR